MHRTMYMVMCRNVIQKIRKIILLFLLFFGSLCFPRTGAVVQELTPELAERLRQKQKGRYFVMMNTGPCDESCRALEKFVWEPLSHRVPWELWTRLDCVKYRDLCHELSTKERVKSITGGRNVDFMTVACSQTSPSGRIVELYRASQASPIELVEYYRDMIARKLPFEAMMPDEIERNIAANDTRREPVSLAVLVLTTNCFTRPDVWEAFAKSGKEQIRIFVHNKSGGNSSVSSNVMDVPRVFSHRGTIALVRPVLQLLRFAMAYGGASHHVVVSGDSVPLMSAPAMIAELSKYNQTRFEKHAQDEFKVDPELRRPYKGKFRKSKNWIVLNAQAARFFANPEHDYTFNFDILSMADEYYWINVAQEYNVSWANLPVMYDEWPQGIQAERPRILMKVNATQLRSRGHLFARKIVKETELLLDWMHENENEQCFTSDAES